MPALDGSMPPQLERSAPELSIVVPTFNERENIPRLIDPLRAALPDIARELIVVDDDSLLQLSVK
jgi:dolichol-phosphate mannosyltransferase